MSTPEEQQQQQNQQQDQQQNQQQDRQQDPYGTQTWQSDTWDTGYQPVHPPLGGVPGQPVAPEGWFRNEAQGQAQGQGQAHAQAPAQAGVPWPDGSAGGGYEPYPVQQPPAPVPYQQAAAPEDWYRDEVPAPAPAPAPAQEWAPATEQTAYLPPYPGPEAQAAAPYAGGRHAAAPVPAPVPAEETAYLPPYQEAVAPEGWFRDEAPVQAQNPAQAPAQEWAPAAEQTAYLPPYPGPQSEEAAAEQTAYLPPQAAAPVPVPVPVPEADAAWSPPTLAGNTLRAVDPAQARAEGRSPIIDPGPQAAILTAALGLVLAAAAALGQYAVLVPLVALQGLTAAGWFRLNGMWPARQGIALAFAGALVADAAVLAVDDAYGPGAIIGTLGAWVLITLVLQLRSHADPDERMYGLMASVASAAVAIVCAGYLAASTAAVSVGAAAVAVAVFARALPLPTAPSAAVSLAAAAGAGAAVGGIAGVGAGGALIGLAAGVCALIGLRVAAYDYPSKFVHMTAGVALPLAVAAPAVYLIGRVVS